MSNTNKLNKTILNLFLLTLILAMSIAERGYAIANNDGNSSQRTVTQPRSVGPYCGLYCLYFMKKINNQPVDFSQFVKREYMSSAKGSSLLELGKAAKDNGLYAEPSARLTASSLIESPYPIILHVKATMESKNYDHFELFLGMENGQAKIFNPPESLSLVPLYQIVSKWDGTGLIVSPEPISLNKVLASAQKQLFMSLAIVIAFILLVHWIRNRWFSKVILSRPKLFGLSVGQGAGLVVAALLIGMIYHFSNDAGFLAHANATTSVQQAHTGNFIPKISKERAAKLLEDGVVFIDARLSADFEAGHLEGAINVPVDANDTLHQKAIAGISKDADIVIYCQSSSCPFAEKVSTKLVSEGYSNISIYKGGWADWSTEKKVETVIDKLYRRSSNEAQKDKME